MWQPIETAPRDGTVVLLCGRLSGDIRAGFYWQGATFPWMFLHPGAWEKADPDDWDNHLDGWGDNGAAYWMPLPPAPE